MAAFSRRQTRTESTTQEEHRSPLRTVLTFRPSVSELPLCDSVFRWSFVVADVKRPIPGADFLAEFNLLVDVRHRCLVDAETHESINADFAPPNVLRIFHVGPRSSTGHDKIIDDFPSLLTPTYSSEPRN